MTILALLLSAILIVVAAFHLLWALGYWVPIKDEEALVRTVIGVRNAKRMPGPIPSALICVALLIGAAAPWWPDSRLRTAILILAAFVFAIRGGLAYAPGWRRVVSQEPFATLDRRYYGPLCLGLSALYLILLIGAF